MEFHPISNLFPLMASDEFIRLCADIRANGLIEPIWVCDGQIIDGRNRFRACQQIGVEPRFREWDGSGSLIQFVVSLNVSRRHLNSSQLAVVALEVEAKLAEEAWERQREAPIIAKISTEMPEPTGLVKELCDANPWFRTNAENAHRKQAKLRNARQIYFIRSEDRIKVGISTDPDHRLNEIRTHHPGAVLLGVLPWWVSGIESFIRKKHGSSHISGKWFHASQSLLESIDRWLSQDKSLLKELKNEQNESTAACQAAKICQTNRQYVSDAKRIAAEAPELLEEIRSGSKTIPEAKREIKKMRDDKAKAELIETGKNSACDDRFELISGDFREVLPIQCDVIITDPPYPAQYLEYFADLSKLANESLPVGGLLVVMCGQYYLPKIHEMLGRHLNYLWTAAYLTPGGQSVQVFPRKINTFWKPLLIYSKGTYSGKWFGDVCKSSVNDNDKRFHEWGQSESGMADVIERWTDPGQTILDPFCGASTTGLAALAHGRKFIGIDLLDSNILLSKARLARMLS